MLNKRLIIWNPLPAFIKNGQGGIFRRLWKKNQNQFTGLLTGSILTKPIKFYGDASWYILSIFNRV